MLYLSSKHRNKVAGRYKINYDYAYRGLKLLYTPQLTADSIFLKTESLIFSFEAWTVIWEQD